MTREFKAKTPGNFSAPDEQDVDAVVESPEIAAYIAKQVAAKLDIELQKHNRAALTRAVDASGLPHQDDIDPAKISQMVLTQQGYVVPHGKEPVIK